MLTLQKAVNLISSDKATERSIGLQQYRDIFADDAALDTLGQGEDGDKRWMRTLQALFNCVASDRAACVRKGDWRSAAAQTRNRLQDSAAIVAWLIERCHRHVGPQSLLLTLNHLMQTLDFRGALMEPVAPYYVKALRLLFSYPPHVDHLDTAMWCSCVSLCCNIILECRLDEEQDIDEARQVAQGHASNDKQTTTRPRKTRPEDLDAIKCILFLVRGDHAPLLGPDRMGSMVLFRLASVLHAIPQESSILLPLLQSLVHLITELKVNDVGSVLDFVDLAWMSLLTFYGTRNMASKENLLLTFRACLPVAIHGQRIHLLAALCEEVTNEAGDRLKLQPLSMDCLLLGRQGGKGVLQYRHFSAAPRISSVDFVSWSALELCADLLAALDDMQGYDELSAIDHEQTHKRRRTDNGGHVAVDRSPFIEQLCKQMTSSVKIVVPRQVWHQQCFLFLLERHGDALSLSRHELIVQSLTSLLTSSNNEVQLWSMVSMASCSVHLVPDLMAQAWQHLFRLLDLRQTARAASHLASKLSHNIPRPEAVKSLTGFLSEIETDDTLKLCDATCAFFEAILDLSRSDVTLSRASVPQKILSWLRSAFSASGVGSHSGLFRSFTSTQLSSLVLSILSQHVDLPLSSLSAKSTPTSEWISQQRIDGPIELYMFQGYLDPPHDQVGTAAPASPVSTPPAPISLRCGRMLAKLVRDTDNRLSEVLNNSAGAAFDSFHDAIEVAITCLSVCGRITFGEVDLKQQAITLLGRCIQSLPAVGLSLAEQSRLLQSLDLRAPPRSGMASVNMDNSVRQSSRVDDERRNQLDRLPSYAAVWQDGAMLPVITQVATLLRNVIGKRAEQDGGRDIFDEDVVEQRSTASDTDGSLVSLLRTCACLLVCSSHADAIDTLAKMTQDVSTAQFLILVEQMSVTMRAKAGNDANACHLSVTAQEDILDRIGSDVLASYQHERSEAGHRCAFAFLHATLLQWSSPSQTDGEVSVQDRSIQLCTFFRQQFSKANLSRAVDRSFALLMQQVMLRCSASDTFTQMLPKPLRPPSLFKSLCTLTFRSDMRTRFFADAFVAQLFEQWAERIGDVEQLYQHQQENLPRVMEDHSQMSSRILALANLCIACAPIRRFALFHILEIGYAGDQYDRLISAALGTIARALGFSDRTELWAPFADSLLWAFVTRGYGIETFPFAVLGFPSQQAWAVSSFEFASVGLLIGEEAACLEAFKILCRLADIDEKESVAQCVPTLYARKAIEEITRGVDPKTTQQNVNSWYGIHLGSYLSNKKIMELCEASVDAAMVHTLMAWHEGSVQEMGKAVHAQYADFAQLTEPIWSDEDSLTISAPTIVPVTTVQLQRCLTALPYGDCTTFSSEVVYNVLLGMSGTVASQILPEDRLRLLCALYVYVAMAWSTIAKSPLLISQAMQIVLSHLIEEAQAALTVPLMRALMAVVTPEMPSFSSLMLQTVHAAHQRHATGSDSMREAYDALLKFIENRMVELFGQSEGHTHLRNALYAWPRPLPPSLVAIVGTPGLEDLRRALVEIEMVTAPFLDRCHSAVQGRSSQEAVSLVWLALRYIERDHGGKDEREQQSLASSMANLLHECHGRIPAVSMRSISQMEDAYPLAPQIRVAVANDNSAQPTLLALQQWLTAYLLRIVRSSQRQKASNAAQTLRRILQRDHHFYGNQPPQTRRMLLMVDELRSIATFAPTASLAGLGSSIDRMDADGVIRCAKDHKRWSVAMCNLTISLISAERQTWAGIEVAPLVAMHPNLAPDLLPAMIHAAFRLFLKQGDNEKAKTTSHHINLSLRATGSDPAVYRAIVALVLQLREDPPTAKPLSGDTWITDLDWLLLATRAAEVQLYASALLFLELDREHGRKGKATGTGRSGTEIQYEIYSNIDDPDCFYGVKNADAQDAFERTLEHQGRWDRLFDLSAARYETADGQQDSQAVTSLLHRQGFNRLANQMAEGMGQSASIDYDVAWRTQQWDLPAPTTDVGTRDAAQGLFVALRALHRGDDEEQTARICQTEAAHQLHTLALTNPESTERARHVVRGLMGIREVERWVTGKSELLVQGAGDRFEFDTLEPLLSVQSSLQMAHRRQHLDIALQQVDQAEVDDAAMRESLLSLAICHKAREEGNVQFAINALTQARHRLHGLEDAVKMQIVEEEFANVLWMQGDHAMAADALVQAIERAPALKSVSSRKRRGQALSRLGEWRATARSHQPQAIIHDCFKPALQLLEAANAHNEVAHVCYQYAIFADDQYRALSSSTELAELRTAVAQRLEEVRLLDVEINKYPARAPQQRALDAAKSRAFGMLQLDQALLNEQEKACERFLKEAIEMLARELCTSDRHNLDALMRLTALWFEHHRDDVIVKRLAHFLKRIPSWKFVPIVRQISSRLSNGASTNRTGADASLGSASSNAFYTTVFDTVLRIAMDHPFHAFYHLYALAQGKPERSSQSSRNKSFRAPDTQQSARAEAAQAILDRMGRDEAIRDRIAACHTVSQACVEWAQFKIADPKGQGKGHLRIPAQMRLLRLRNVQVPVLTRDLPVDPTCKYDGFVAIARYGDRYSLAGGIHLPKITECIGSDGKVYRQLFKDKDDLRQDAVMQQVFALVNGLLRQDRQARRRSLHVRTYNIVPLGPQTGLLEFVGNTVPLLTPLTQLYDQFRQSSWPTFIQARSEMEQLTRSAHSTAEQRRNLFLSICQRLPPVFRFYFLQHFTVPMALVQARSLYTRSVATTSIVGHILGLGDRHCSNVLLDQQTGEVVHIDFGVAFDQGRLLRIPELVPFRLTQNLVDGMGLNGVEGTFRQSCQHTLRVLRTGKGVIKTVLEVFRFDPLYAWTQNPIKVIRAQAADNLGRRMEEGEEMDDGLDVVGRPGAVVGGSSTTATTTRTVTAGLPRRSMTTTTGEDKDTAELLALRAIRSVMDKLSNDLSVEYTVNDLMGQAMDPTNLGSIYYGWQPFL